MTRLLVVLQFTGRGAVQDFLRGRLLEPDLRKKGYAVRYIGRHLALRRWQTRTAPAILRALGASLPYRALAKAIDKAAVAVNNARIVRAARKADVVHFIKTDSFPLIERVRSASTARLLYDLADALWLPDFQQSYPQLNQSLATVDAVTCDNRFGIAFAARHARAVYPWRLPSQVELFDKKRPLRQGAADPSRALTIGWIGSPGTAYSLFLVTDALERVAMQWPNIQLRIVGVPADHPVLRRLERISWSTIEEYDQERMATEALAMDIGLHPLFDTDFGRMHGVLKAEIYMAAGIPVVASPVGEVPDIIENGKSGFLASNTDEWTEALTALIGDAENRATIGANGLQIARARFSLAKSIGDYIQALQGDPGAPTS